MLEGECYPEVPVTLDVPQAQFLAPSLSVYINDLTRNIQSQVRLFADDTAVYLTVTNPNGTNILQSDLDTLQESERTWDMKFNRFCILAEPGSLSTPSIPSMARYFILLTVPVTMG